MTSHVLSGLIFAAVLAQAAQPVPSPAVAEVRQMAADARKEIDSYKAAGGAAGTADHPAVKWSASIWQVHERAPLSEEGAIAAVESVRLLVRAELWDAARARIDSVGVDEPAWERLPSPIYDIGIARKDLPDTIDTLSKAAAATTKPKTKAAALLIVGRAYRRQGDKAAATRALEAAKSAAPDSLYAEEADGVIYEIVHLSPGTPAPAVSGKARNGRAVNLAAFRGKAVVLVFWGTT
jgi:hypothetical protein